MGESREPSLFESRAETSLQTGCAELLASGKSEATRFLGEFAHSFAFSATQSPLNGVVQLADKTLGTNFLPKVQVIDGPEATKSGSAEWHGQILGGAAGVACDFLLLRKVFGARAAEVPLSTQVKRSALTGAVLNGIFRPTSNDEDFLTARMRGATLGALTFGSMAALQRPVENLLGKGGVRSALLSGVIIGAPVGAGEAWLNNVSGGKKQDVAEAAYASALTGGLLSHFHAFGRRNTPALCKSVVEQLPIVAEAPGPTRSVSSVRRLAPGDMTPVMEIAAHYKLPPRAGSNTMVLVVDGKVRGYANLNDTHRSVGEVAVLPQYRPHSLALLGAVRQHIQAMGGVWHTMARSSTSANLLDKAAKRGTIEIVERSEAFRGPTEDMRDFKFVVRPTAKGETGVSGRPLRDYLGLTDAQPVQPSSPTRTMSEGAHEQSNQWISSHLITGKLTPGVRIAPGFGEQISSNGKQRGARYALIEVDETRDPTLQRILKDSSERFSDLAGNRARQAEELARYVRRICNPDNEGIALERRAEAMLAESAGQAIPLGEFILQKNCLCVQSSLLYKKLADAHGIPTTLRSSQLSFGQHAWPESIVNKQSLVYDSARAQYGAPSYLQPSKRPEFRRPPAITGITVTDSQTKPKDQ